MLMDLETGAGTPGTVHETPVIRITTRGRRTRRVGNLIKQTLRASVEILSSRATATMVSTGCWTALTIAFIWEDPVTVSRSSRSDGSEVQVDNGDDVIGTGG